MRPPDRRVLLALLVLALASRLVWALWIHPTEDYVFRDMRGYWDNARQLVEHGLDPHRRLAFQAWGTHTLLALPLALFGAHDLFPAAILWAILAAAAVPLTYLLACRVCSRPWLPALVGVAALLWYPNVVNSGFFLAEAPLLGFLYAALWRLTVLLQDGRGALGSGLLCATCIALRPETAIFMLFALGLWLRVRRDHPVVRWRHVGLVALPVMLVLSFSAWHFHHHTGRWGGVAESAYINLTLGRCQSARVQGYGSSEQFEHDDGNNIGAVGTPVFAQRLLDEEDGWLTARPVFGTTPRRLEIPDEPTPRALRIGRRGMSIKFHGDPRDPAIHAAIRRACIAETGFWGQFRISASNLEGLWFANSQWPDSSDHGEPWRPWSDAFVTLFQWLVWLPSLLGVYWALRDARSNPGLALCALPLLGIMAVAAIWFGDIRIRTPYDPLALLLAAEAYARVAAALRGAARRRVPQQVDRSP